MDSGRIDWSLAVIIFIVFAIAISAGLGVKCLRDKKIARRSTVSGCVKAVRTIYEASGGFFGGNGVKVTEVKYTDGSVRVFNGLNLGIREGKCHKITLNGYGIIIEKKEQIQPPTGKGGAGK